MIVTVVINALWQGALIVALTALTLRFVSGNDATTRYAAWFCALLAVLAVPPLSAGVHLALHPFSTTSHSVVATSSTFSLVALGPLAAGAARWLVWPSTLSAAVDGAIAILWIAGALVALARLAISFTRITRIRHAATEIFRIDGVPVLASSDLAIPIATGIFAPAIVVPKELLQILAPGDLRCTLEHELAHVRRADVASNAIQRILEALFFWNPWVHTIGRRLIDEREAACDDCAVRRLGESEAYARALAEIGCRVGKNAAPLLTPSVVRSRHALVMRIERLMSDRSPQDSKFNYLAIGGLTMLFALMTLTLLIVVPAPAHATAVPVNVANGAVVATLCKNPNAPPEALNAVRPDLPRSEQPSHTVSAVVVVNVAANGKAAGARIERSSGDAAVDRSVVKAALLSTYRAKLVNCAPVDGIYLFKATFSP
ncbi:MAG: M56 family metallopeptidase [Candidatus Eremiobacteraeota bacterium]|nr:M56 family metallopeptidase [Candidatus Eremiobacteraeota bacterium]